MDFGAPNMQYIAFNTLYLHTQKCQFILTNAYKSMFLQHQHNMQSIQTLAHAIFQARKMTFTSFQRCKCFCQLSHI